jgi:hemolysin activation/secretion protein
LRGFQRSSSNSVNDVEIEVQRRRVGGWELGLNHREFIGNATLDANVPTAMALAPSARCPAPEEFFGEGTSRMRMVTADVSLNAPFNVGGQRCATAACGARNGTARASRRKTSSRLAGATRCAASMANAT